MTCSTIPKFIMITDGLDDQLKLAIQLSLQESTAAISRQLKESANSAVSASQQPQSLPTIQSTTTNQQPQRYQRTNADITVDYFLRSLANHKIDLKNISGSAEGRDSHSAVIGVTDGGNFFKPCNGNEDGRFQISDIHENGFGFGDDEDDYDENDVKLKRSHSTGDLCIRRSGRGFRVRPGGDEPRYRIFIYLFGSVLYDLF